MKNETVSRLFDSVIDCLDNNDDEFFAEFGYERFSDTLLAQIEHFWNKKIKENIDVPKGYTVCIRCNRDTHTPENINNGVVTLGLIIVEDIDGKGIDLYAYDINRKDKDMFRDD